VIHNIISGCPSNAPGDLSNGESPDTFQFIIPKGMPNRQYTLAWIWFNKIGNYEMYTNGATITVTSGVVLDKAISEHKISQSIRIKVPCAEFFYLNFLPASLFPLYNG